MSAIRVVATSDIPPELILQLATRARPTVEIEDDGLRLHHRSNDAPSWIHFLQTPEFWIQTIVGSIAWDMLKGAIVRRHAIVGAVQASAKQKVLDLSIALAELGNQLDSRTRICLGCPTPNDIFATLMVIRGRESEQISTEIADFLACLPVLEEFYQEHEGNLTGQVVVSITDADSLSIEWMDRATLSPQRTVYRLS